MKQGGIWQNQLLRQTVQAALAVGLSIAFGSMLSGRRWYWAAIAAFLVGMGVESRSESLIKGLQRVGGTILGIIAGILLASVVSGYPILALALVLICVFFAFYAFQQAYGMMVFWITLMVALLYGLLGMFKPSLLVLRLEETAIGAAVGVVVTTFVLPIRGGDAVRSAAAAFLDALSDLVKQASHGTPDDRVSIMRAVQSKAQALRSAVGPSKRGWAPLAPPGHRRVAHVGMYCAFLARELAQRNQVGDAAVVLDEIQRLRDSLQDPSEPCAVSEATTEDESDAGDQADPATRALQEAVRRFGQELQSF